VSNYVRVTTLGYVSVSTQMHWQNAMWVRRNCWQCGLSCKYSADKNAVNFMDFSVFVCCVFSGLCNDMVTCSEESYRMCLCLTVCDLGTLTNSHPSPQFGCSNTKRHNTKFTYRLCNYSRRLLPPPRQCGGFSCVGHL